VSVWVMIFNGVLSKPVVDLLSRLFGVSVR